MPERIIRTLHATLSDGSEVRQGDVVDLEIDDEESLDAQGALVPEGWDSFQAFHDASVDAYRGGRGDVEANARALNLAAESRRGGVTDVSVPSDGNPFVKALRDDSPSVDETVALADGDPAKAAQLLEAENVVTGGAPRKGVVEGLERISAADGQ